MGFAKNVVIWMELLQKLDCFNFHLINQRFDAHFGSHEPRKTYLKKKKKKVTHAHTHTHTHARTHALTHSHTHTHTHTHTHHTQTHRAKILVCEGLTALDVIVSNTVCV